MLTLVSTVYTSYVITQVTENHFNTEYIKLYLITSQLKLYEIDWVGHTGGITLWMAVKKLKETHKTAARRQ